MHRNLVKLFTTVAAVLLVSVPGSSGGVAEADGGLTAIPDVAGADIGVSGGIDITDLWTSDLDGNRKRRFSPGEPVRYNVMFDVTGDNETTYKVQGSGKAKSARGDTWKTKIPGQALKRVSPGEYSMSWDSTVPNAAISKTGARLVIRTKLRSVGRKVDTDRALTKFRVK